MGPTPIPHTSPTDLRKVEELRTALRHTHFWALPPHREWLTDRTLLRFLIAVRIFGFIREPVAPARHAHVTPRIYE